MIKKFYVNEVKEVKPFRDKILVHVKDIEEYTEKYNDIRNYYGTNDGHQLFVHIDNTSSLREADFQVTDAILQNKLGLKAVIANL